MLGQELKLPAEIMPLGDNGTESRPVPGATSPEQRLSRVFGGSALLKSSGAPARQTKALTGPLVVLGLEDDEGGVAEEFFDGAGVFSLDAEIEGRLSTVAAHF